MDIKDPSIQILSDITVFTKYAKYNDSLKRRENWTEIVNRNREMHKKNYPMLTAEIDRVYDDFVLTKKVLPSMRSLQFGGKPIELSPNRVFNCAYLPIDDWRAFGEVMFLLLGGTGVGYSVQYHHVEKLPEIRKPKRSRRFLIGDSIEGWADAVKYLVKSYFTGGVKPKFDYQDIRPKGARLITSGGKAPGPEPLKRCIQALESLLDSKAEGDQLTTLEVHDMICHIADAVLAGGIRRAALIALFSTDDAAMLACKSNFKVTSWNKVYEDGPTNLQGEHTKVLSVHLDPIGKKYYDVDVTVEEPHYGTQQTRAYWVSEEDIKKLEATGTLPWYYFQPQRGRSNNSAVIIRNRIKKAEFMNLWKRVEASGSGEPGIYFSNDKDWGTNPCAEIALRPFQFCNLTEVNASDLTPADQTEFNERSKAAAFIGTLQAGYTDFHYLRPIWKKTTDKDALIGVGITGIASGGILGLNLTEGAELVKEENARVAKIIGINPAARTTTVKPSGTTSLVVGSSSGIHAWHNYFYIRRMRIGKNESIYRYLSVFHPELVKDEFFSPETTSVIEIPQKAPSTAIVRTESCFDLLERVKKFNLEWVKPGHRDGYNTHNVSATISLKENEWQEAGEWMWKNKDCYNGLSVLPYDGGTYIQPPFEDITEEQFNELSSKLHNIDLNYVIEEEDTTNLKDQVACAGAACEVNI